MSISITLIGDAAYTGAGSFQSLPAYNQTAGHCIVVVAGGATGGSYPLPPTDTAGNIYLPIFNGTLASNVQQMWYASNCKGNAANVIQFNASATTYYGGFAAYDVSGVSANCLDQVSYASGSSSAPAVPAFNTFAANEAVIVFNAISAAYATASAGSGFSALDFQTGRTGNEVAGESKVVSTLQSSYAPGFSLGASGAWNCFAITLANTTQNLAQLVQANWTYFANAVASTSESLAFTVNNTAGNLIFVIVGWTGAVTATISDTAGNSYTQLPTVTSGSGHMAVAYALNCKSGANTIQAAFSGAGATYIQISAGEWSGVNTLESYAQGTTAKSITTAGACDLIIGYGNGVAISNALDSGFVSAGTGLNSQSALEYIPNQPPGTYTKPIFAGQNEVGIAAFNYVAPTVATSTFSPVAGTYTSAQAVTFNNVNSGLAGFAMYYTTDGSTPTTGSTLYSAPITVSVTETVKVLAVATGYTNSAIASAAYTINSVTAYSVPDCRVSPFGPNSSRTVNGTVIYDVQTSDNAAVPGQDCRVAGAPVDCRVSPNIPQNSRAPGTYGPNE